MNESGFRKGRETSSSVSKNVIEMLWAETFYDPKDL